MEKWKKYKVIWWVFYWEFILQKSLEIWKASKTIWSQDGALKDIADIMGLIVELSQVTQTSLSLCQ